MTIINASTKASTNAITLDFMRSPPCGLLSMDALVNLSPFPSTEHKARWTGAVFRVQESGWQSEIFLCVFNAFAILDEFIIRALIQLSIQSLATSSPAALTPATAAIRWNALLAIPLTEKTQGSPPDARVASGPALG